LDILYTQFFEKKIFGIFFRILKKSCFGLKKVDGKSSKGHNFSTIQPICKYLGILERSCGVDFRKIMDKKFGTKTL
jgi:hypothetical protein